MCSPVELITSIDIGVHNSSNIRIVIHHTIWLVGELVLSKTPLR